MPEAVFLYCRRHAFRILIYVLFGPLIGTIPIALLAIWAIGYFPLAAFILFAYAFGTIPMALCVVGVTRIEGRSYKKSVILSDSIMIGSASGFCGAAITAVVISFTATIFSGAPFDLGIVIQIAITAFTISVLPVIFAAIFAAFICTWLFEKFRSDRPHPPGQASPSPLA